MQRISQLPVKTDLDADLTIRLMPHKLFLALDDLPGQVGWLVWWRHRRQSLPAGTRAETAGKAVEEAVTFCRDSICCEIEARSDREKACSAPDWGAQLLPRASRGTI